MEAFIEKENARVMEMREGDHHCVGNENVGEGFSLNDENETENCCSDAKEDREEEKTGYNREKPPKDDCCPICFGDFKVPCRANCGHWFCGGCILQLWEYRSRPQRCKCPFCSSGISKLTPEASAVNQTEKEAVDVLKNIQQYNCFYVGGLKGSIMLLFFLLRKHGPIMHLHIWGLLQALFMVVIVTPEFVKSVFVDLIKHPERIRLNFQRVRLIACTLTLLLNVHYGFLPPGQVSLRIAKLRLWIDGVSIALVVVPYIILMSKTYIQLWWLRFCIWQVRKEVAALQAQNAALREQEAALQNRQAAHRAENAVLKREAAALRAENAAVDGQGVAIVEAACGAARPAKVGAALLESKVLLQPEPYAVLQAEAGGALGEEPALQTRTEASFGESVAA